MGQKDAPSSWPCLGQTGSQGGCGPTGDHWEHRLLAPRHLGEGRRMAPRECVGSGGSRRGPALPGCPRICYFVTRLISQSDTSPSTTPAATRAVFSSSWSRASWACCCEATGTRGGATLCVMVVKPPVSGLSLTALGACVRGTTSPVSPVSTGGGTGVSLMSDVPSETPRGCPTGAMMIWLLYPATVPIWSRMSLGAM